LVVTSMCFCLRKTFSLLWANRNFL
jgi:hypothetical protein